MRKEDHHRLKVKEVKKSPSQTNKYVITKRYTI